MDENTAKFQRMRDRLFAKCLPIVGYRVQLLSCPGRQKAPGPVIVIDAREDPATQDLCRACYIEAIEADVLSKWIGSVKPEPGWMVGIVRVSRPVRCVFRFGFEPDKHRGLLKWMARASSVAVTTSLDRAPILPIAREDTPDYRELRKLIGSLLEEASL